MSRACSVAGVAAVTLGGTPAERSAIVQRFGSDVSVRSLLLHCQTDCSGINLIAANHLMLLDPVVSVASAAQLLGRICRLGQTRPCTVYHCVADGTVESALVRGSGGGSGDAVIMEAAARVVGGGGNGDATEIAPEAPLAGAIVTCEDVESAVIALFARPHT